MKITVVLSILLCALVSCNKQNSQTQKEALRVKVNLYMHGNPVNPSGFPWHNAMNGTPDRAILEFYLKEGEIDQKEFDALSSPVTCWVKQGYEK